MNMATVKLSVKKKGLCVRCMHKMGLTASVTLSVNTVCPRVVSVSLTTAVHIIDFHAR